MTQPVVIILAAGKGERFLASGAITHKLDALLSGTPVLMHVMNAVKASGLPWHLVRPPGGTAGMGASVALGVRATPDAPGWLILPGDLPLIQSATLRWIATALHRHPLVVPFFQQQHGHPVAFSRRYFSALAALDGEDGAREIVREARHHGDVADLHLNDPGIVQDVDTLTDLLAMEQASVQTRR